MNSYPASRLVSGILLVDGIDQNLRQAVIYFLRQTHLEKELLLVLAGDASGLTGLPEDARIKVVPLPARATLRERWACALENCRGRYVAWWDPADWIGPERLAAQILALAQDRAAMCVADSVTGYSLQRARAWCCREDRPGVLARKTWFGDRESAAVPFAKPFSAAVLPLIDAPEQVLTGVQVSRIEAPWYLWMLNGSALPSLPTGDLSVRETPAGEAIRAMALDRPHFARLRARHCRRWRTDGVRSHPRPVRTPALTSLKSSGAGRRETFTSQTSGQVSCLMPTFNRSSYVTHAIACFLAQDYPHRELVIVDDSTESIEDLVPSAANIIYLRVRPQRSIGAKRNLAIAASRGDYLMCWDDDDWSGPGRIRHQIAPMRAGMAHATALLTGYILDQRQCQFWSRKAGRASALFQHGVNWGTLAWSRGAQSAGVRFPDSSLAEDVAFKDALVRNGARVQCLENPGHYVYVRHGANSWKFEEQKVLLRDHWQPIPPPSFFPPAAVSFYGLSLPPVPRLPGAVPAEHINSANLPHERVATAS